MPVGNISYILSPSLPIAARTTLLYDFSINAVFPLFKIIETQLQLTIAFRVTAALTVTSACYTDNLNIIGLFLVEINLIDRVIETVIVRS